MNANTPRYLIENEGPDEEALKTALAAAIQVCKRDSISEITLLILRKSNLQGSAIENVLSAPRLNALCKGKTILVDDALTMNLDSVRTYSPYGPRGMVIGVHLMQDGLDKLDASDSAKAIMFLPYNEEKGKAWLSTWNPTVLGKSTWTAPIIAIESEVENALRTLTDRINLSTDLTHPSDKKFAKTTFEDLKANGHRPDPEEIRKWALQNNWQPRHAKELTMFAAKHFK